MEQIGRYQITGELGRGAMGIVYRALDPSIGRTVAIKTIRLTELTDPNERARLRDRLFREARSAGVLSHPNIITIYDVAEQDGLTYIAMEYVDGPTLDRFVVRESVDREMVLSIIKETAAAIDYASSKGVIHRDIKPANIMLSESRTVKIADFGVARLQSQQMTQAGVLLGTPNYMSPEQIQGGEIDGRSDQFSLGVIAYELLTGERPFAAESMPTVIFKIVHEPPVAPRRLNPSLAWPVDTVVQRVLAKNPEERYPTCTEFATALENSLKVSGEWKPLTPGGAEALPTVIEDPLKDAEAAAVPGPPVVIPPITAPLTLYREQGTPPLLRAARALAVFILAAGGVVFAIWAVLQWSGSRETRTAASTTQSQPPPVAPEPVQKPSAMPEVPAAESPGAARPEEVPEPPKKEVEPEPLPRRTQRQREPAPTPGQLHLITSPPGATITLDTGETCKTPCDVEVSPGRHVVTANLEGHRKALRIMEFPRDTEVYLPLERTSGTLAVRSTPPGADIILNGQPRGEKTPAVLHLPPGHYKLEVSKEGMAKDVDDVEVKDSGITNVDVNFSR